MATNLNLTPKTEAPAPAPMDEAEEHPLLTLRQEVDRLFDNFFSGFTLGPFGRRTFDLEPLRRAERMIPGWGEAWPKMDVIENDTEYRASLELPGMDEKDVNITIDGNILTIKGETREERKEEKGRERKRKEEKDDYRLTERHFGAVKRSFRLPETVEQDKIDAVFEKGILTVTLPKTKETKKGVRKITVKGR